MKDNELGMRIKVPGRILGLHYLGSEVRQRQGWNATGKSRPLTTTATFENLTHARGVFKQVRLMKGFWA